MFLRTDKMLRLLFIVAFVAHVGTTKEIQARDTHCYTGLGCFQSHGNIPFPDDPSVIHTKFGLQRRGSSQIHHLDSLNYQSNIASWSSHFDSSKKTKIIIHGFMDSGSTSWIPVMTTALLKKDDFNVITVDWGNGASAARTYEHAAGNTYLVGKETAMLLTYLHDSHGLNYTDVHIIGHSLGAQVAGTVGHEIMTIGRITGLDPADPGFTGTPANRHLDATDAVFVDVIHTDASKFNVISGYGTHDAVGDVDFYPNGGEHQPGCTEKPLNGAISGILHGHLSGIGDSVTCSHSRSRDLFIESINSNCHFYGHLCPSADGFEAGNCLGCPSGGCPMMGYNADQTQNQKGTFYLSTSGKSPYCGHEYFVDVKVSEYVLHTYGEFIVTLVGTKGQSEPLKLESQMHTITHGREEKHVIATHTDIGSVTAVKLEFIRAKDAHAILSTSSVRVHSVFVEPAETGHRTTFCAHEQRIHSGATVTLTSQTGC